MKITNHFSLGTSDQIVCPCCKRVKMTELFFHSMEKLEELRQRCGPLIVNCGYRCGHYNAMCNIEEISSKRYQDKLWWKSRIPDFSVEAFREELLKQDYIDKASMGAPNSMHLEFAIDIRPPGSPNMTQLNNIAFEAKELDFSGIGRYNTFVHLDARALLDRPHAAWDSRSE